MSRYDRELSTLPDASIQKQVPNTLINVAVEGRGPNYLKNGTRYNRNWMDTIDIPSTYQLPEITVAIGAGLDTLYDTYGQQVQSGQFNVLSGFIDQTINLVDPFSAKEFLLSYNTEEPADMHDAVLYLIAYITYYGSIELLETPDILFLWIDEWRKSLITHSLLELQKATEFADPAQPVRLPVEPHIPIATSLEGGIREFENRYESTSGLPTAMIPIFPFILNVADAHSFHEYISIVRRLSGIFRIAQDAIIDLQSLLMQVSSLYIE